MESKKDVEIVVSGRQIVIPNAIMTIVLVVCTAGLFYIMESPEYAALASAGFALLMMGAKAVQVNFEDVLSVLGKEEDDLPDSVAPLMAPLVAPLMAPLPGDAESDVELHVTQKSKVRAFLLG